LNSNLDHELYEKARKRTKQKKRLYFHFVFFLVGSVFLVVLNKVVKFHEEVDWYVWGILVWMFFVVIHAIRVLVMDRFFDKDWERVQTEKLIQKHEVRVDKLEKKLTKKGLIPPPEESDTEF
jgi:hypothetical protein